MLVTAAACGWVQKPRASACQPGRLRLGVVVEQHDDASVRGVDGRVATGHKAHVAPIDDHAHVRIVTLDQRHRVVAAGVVDDDGLEVAERLLGQGIQHAGQIALAVVGGDDHRQKGRDRLPKFGKDLRRARHEVVGRRAEVFDVERDLVAHDHAVFFAQRAVRAIGDHRIGPSVRCWFLLFFCHYLNRLLSIFQQAGGFLEDVHYVESAANACSART